MTQPQDKMRAEFEAWYAQRFPDPRHENSTWDHAEKMDALEVWQAACAQQSAQSQQDALDAERWRAFEGFLRTGRIPGAGHGRRIKLTETCPVYGDEKDVNDIRAAVDVVIAARASNGGKA